MAIVWIRCPWLTHALGEDLWYSETALVPARIAEFEPTKEALDAWEASFGTRPNPEALRNTLQESWEAACAVHDVYWPVRLDAQQIRTFIEMEGRDDNPQITFLQQAKAVGLFDKPFGEGSVSEDDHQAALDLVEHVKEETAATFRNVPAGAIFIDRILKLTLNRRSIAAVRAAVANDPAHARTVAIQQLAHAAAKLPYVANQVVPALEAQAVPA